MNRTLPHLRIACAVGLGLLASLQAADYYVDPAGNDAAAGTSAGAAWRTLSKVNAASFSPGDTIRFKRGGTWRESLSPASSGAAGNPIVFDAYGSGAKPVFYGSDLMANAAFTDLGGGVYQYDVGAGHFDASWGYVLADHAFIGVAAAPVSGTRINVTLAGNPASDGRTYTLCRRGNVVHSNGRSHLVFRNLVVDETAANSDAAHANDALGYGFRIMGSSDVVVEDCEALRCGRHNFASINSDQVVFRRCRAAWVAPAVPGGSSLYVSYADNGLAAASSTSLYEACTADNQGGYDIFNGHGNGDPKPLHVTFRGVVSNGGKFYCDSAPGGSYAFLGGRLNGGRIENFVPGIVIDGVLFAGTAWIDQYKSGTIQNCVWDNVNPAEDLCVKLRHDVSDNVIRFNTIRTSKACVGTENASVAGIRMYGNIFAGSLSGNAASFIESDWNCFLTAPSEVFGQPWAAWQATRDAHSVVADPAFENAAGGDYRLKASSQLIDAAAVPADHRPGSDAAGAARPQGAACDIGAYELVATGGQVPVISSRLDAWTSTQTVLAYRILANHGPTSYGASPLPAGLAFDAATGVISGTPSAPSTYTIHLSARNAAGEGKADLVLRATANAFWPYAGIIVLPGRIEAEAFDNGGPEVAYHDSDAENHGYLRSDTQVDIDRTIGGDDDGFGLGWTAGGEWLKYTVQVAAAGDYRFDARVTNGNADAQQITVAIDGGAPVAIAIAPTGGYHSFQTFASAAIPLTQGIHVVTLGIGNAGLGINHLTAVQLTGNKPPRVSLLTPADGTHCTAPAGISLGASAGDDDGGIALVEFRNGATVVGSDSTPPYACTLTGVPAGTYVLSARAVDDLGAAWESSPVTVVVDATSDGGGTGTGAVAAGPGSAGGSCGVGAGAALGVLLLAAGPGLAARRSSAS